MQGAPTQADGGEGLGPLAADEVALITTAAVRAHQATRASTLASFHGWSFAACALLCVPLALADPTLLLVGLVLGVIAAVELRGGRKLRAFEASGARLLALNQLVLLALVWIYCGWRLWGGLTGPSPSEQLLEEVPDMAQLLASTAELSGLEPMFDHIDHIYRVSLIALYGGIIGASSLYQGLCAFYYWSRGPHLSAYLSETPSWVRELLRRARG